MTHAGYKWSLKEEDGRWLWAAIGRDDQQVLVEGVAASRAEAAAFLIRALARGVLGEPDQVAA